jgi:hypothetical protein
VVPTTLEATIVRICEGGAVVAGVTPEGAGGVGFGWFMSLLSGVVVDIRRRYSQRGAARDMCRATISEDADPGCRHIPRYAEMRGRGTGT